jgi:Spy/CpxP family protein refolding chaperone
MQVRRILIASVAGVALALGTGAALAEGHRHADHGWGGDPGMGEMHQMLQDLDLSPEQKETVHGIMENSRPRFEALHEEMRANRDILLDVNPGDANYQTVVNRVSQQSGDLASRLVLAMSDVRSQIYGVLTDEQKAKLPAIRAAMKARMDEHHAKMRERMQSDRQQKPTAAPTDGTAN